MKPAAMPAAEISQVLKSQPANLKLVRQPDEKLAIVRPIAERDDPNAADEFDDMWDNLPV